jgi:hypothetical protein
MFIFYLKSWTPIPRLPYQNWCPAMSAGDKKDASLNAGKKTKRTPQNEVRGLSAATCRWCG